TAVVVCEWAGGNSDSGGYSSYLPCPVTVYCRILRRLGMGRARAWLDRVTTTVVGAVNVYSGGGGDFGAAGARAAGRLYGSRVACGIYGVLRCFVSARSYPNATCTLDHGLACGGLLGVGTGGQCRALLVGEYDFQCVGRLVADDRASH